MINIKSEFSLKPHPQAPIHSLPPYDQVILPTSTNTSVCNGTEKHLRVLVIPTVQWDNHLRQAIRETYTNFSCKAEGKPCWRRLFVVGSPRTENERKQLEFENNIFHDVLVLNLLERYRFLTLKMLIALKYVACHCPNAQYFVKADDDTFLNVPALDREIEKTGNTLRYDEAQNAMPKKQGCKHNTFTLK